MDSLNDKVSKKFERLLRDGADVLANPSKREESVPDIEYIRFRTEVMNLVRLVCGESSDHYQELGRIAEGQYTARNSHYFQDCVGVLRAAHADYNDGLLFNVRALIAAEVLSDFIDQAESLLGAGHLVAAVSVAGAVLEDAMRKVCVSKNLPVPEKTTISGLNADLARVGVYDRLVMKRITALGELRNNADHGHFDRVTSKEDEARDMVNYVRRFCADHLALEHLTAG